jgi:DNA polymerase-1
MLLIFDTYSVLYRLFFALPDLSHNNLPVNAIYGLVKLLIKVSKEYKPNYLCFCIDKGRSLRKDSFDSYKSNRVQTSDKFKQQIPIFYKLSKVLNFKVYGFEGFEADDVIFSIVKLLKSSEIAIYVITGDKDLFQVIDDNVSVILMKRGMSDIEVFDQNYFLKTYGFSSKYYVYYKALVGDPSDNIDGVKNIGHKKAFNIIKKIESKSLDSFDQIKTELLNFTNQIEIFERNYNLISLRDCSDIVNFSLEDLKFDNNFYNKKEFIDFLKEYNFLSIIRELNYSDVQMKFF